LPDPDPYQGYGPDSGIYPEKFVLELHKNQRRYTLFAKGFILSLRIRIQDLDRDPGSGSWILIEIPDPDPAKTFWKCLIFMYLDRITDFFSLRAYLKFGRICYRWFLFDLIGGSGQGSTCFVLKFSFMLSFSVVDPE
jgi:hypothetical protein